MFVTKIEPVKLKNLIVLKISGSRFDASFASHFKQEVFKYLKEYDSFAVDLTEISFMDSTGLGAIVYLLKKLKEKDKKNVLKLVGVNIRIQRMFALAGMDKVFVTYDTMNDALGDADYDDYYEKISG